MPNAAGMSHAVTLPVRRALTVLAKTSLDLLLPPQCLTCDAPVPTQGLFCATCFRQTAFVTDPSCQRCGVPFAHAGEAGPGRICLACQRTPPPWERARAALRYDAQARHLVLPFKYGDRVDLTAPLAALMARAGATLIREADLIVPVPLHRRRLFTRRYNQAALLARALGRIARRRVAVDALVRTRATTILGELSAAERAQAIAGAFAVRPSRAAQLAGRRVLLIDDVLTSGATAAACAAALLDAQCEAVDVLVVARVPDPRLT